MYAEIEFEGVDLGIKIIPIHTDAFVRSVMVSLLNRLDLIGNVMRLCHSVVLFFFRCVCSLRCAFVRFAS